MGRREQRLPRFPPWFLGADSPLSAIHSVDQSTFTCCAKQKRCRSRPRPTSPATGRNQHNRVQQLVAITFPADTALPRPTTMDSLPTTVVSSLSSIINKALHSSACRALEVTCVRSIRELPSMRSRGALAEAHLSPSLPFSLQDLQQSFVPFDLPFHSKHSPVLPLTPPARSLPRRVGLTMSPVALPEFNLGIPHSAPSSAWQHPLDSI